MILWLIRTCQTSNPTTFPVRLIFVNLLLNWWLVQLECKINLSFTSMIQTLLFTFLLSGKVIWLAYLTCLLLRVSLIQLDCRFVRLTGFVCLSLILECQGAWSHGLASDTHWLQWPKADCQLDKIALPNKIHSFMVASSCSSKRLFFYPFSYNTLLCFYPAIGGTRFLLVN